MNKKSKQPISVIQRKLWEECRRVAFLIYKDKNDQVHCYTCPARNLQKFNRQLGHVPWAKSTLGAFLKYDLRVLRWQCMRCNIHAGGQGAEAYKKMLKEEGKQFMAQLEKDRQKTVKAYDYYLSLLEYYKSL